MQELKLPHLYPIKFAKYILAQDELSARVQVEFDSIPSFGMLIESAAQSSAAIGTNESSRMGFLVSLKNVKLLNPPTKTILEVKVTNEHSMENMKMMQFDIFEDEIHVSTGSFMLMIEN